MDTILKLKELGFQLIPINNKKRPTVSAWQKGGDFKLNGYGIGLVCGLEMQIEVIDIDCKYDLTRTLFERYKKAINEVDKNLLKKLVVQKTVSGGYHFYYRCSEIQGNKKLANRISSEDEKNETFDKTYKEKIEEGETHEEAIIKANKSKENDKVKGLIETRGVGGYAAIYPTPGYEFIYKTLFDIQEITPEEREILISEAIKFNEVIEKKEPIITRATKQDYNNDLTPWEDYNNRGDVHNVLTSNGWKQVGSKGNKILYLRPGSTTSAHSGNFDEEKNWFSVFTTSSQFEPQKAYNRFSVYATLECNGDFKEAAKRLYNLGYGTRIKDYKNKESIKHEDKQETKNSEPKNIYNQFRIINQDLILNELEQYHREGAKPGVYLGHEPLEEYYSMLTTGCTDWIGWPQSGKTELLLECLYNTSVFYGWKHLLFVPDIGNCIEVIAILIHKHTGKTFDKKYKNYIDWKTALQSLPWLFEHFHILEPIDHKSKITPIEFWEFACEYKKEKGIQTATIDSWKDMYHDYSKYGGNYAKYLSEVLPARNKLSEINDIHFHTIVHPKNPQRNSQGKIPPARVDDMEGGAQWNNSGKVIICADRSSIESTIVDIYILKNKPKIAGKRGMTCLNYDVATSKYYSISSSNNGEKQYAKPKEQKINSNQFPGLQPNTGFENSVDLSQDENECPF